MSHYLKGDEMSTSDDLKVALENPKVDAKKVSEVRELLRVLRAQGVSRPESNLILPFTRQVYVESKYGKAKS